MALQKVYNFSTSNIFETCVSGRMVADMCRAAAKVFVCIYKIMISIFVSTPPQSFIVGLWISRSRSQIHRRKICGYVVSYVRDCDIVAVKYHLIRSYMNQDSFNTSTNMSYCSYNLIFFMVTLLTHFLHACVSASKCVFVSVCSVIPLSLSVCSSLTAAVSFFTSLTVSTTLCVQNRLVCARV